MAESKKTYSITIDLNQFKLHIALKNRIELTLHFNSPSRRFYLSIIAFVVNEMKGLRKITSIPLKGHLDLLVLLNETIGGSAGSSKEENLLSRIYGKWQHALPNLEEAPLFMVLGRKKGYEEGVRKTYPFTEAEKDNWANLFEYKGSHENVRLKFAIDKIGVSLDDTLIIFGESRNGDAWDQFISSLKNGRKEESEPLEETTVSEPPAVPFSSPQERKTSWFFKYRWVMLVVVIGIVAGAIWRTYLKLHPDDVAFTEKMAFPLPNVPSIAVMPFANMSGDPKQEFLCDGMTEEIITALSKVPQLFVIARNSTFTYKGKPVRVKQVSEELGVQYVLEGSFQRSGDRVRIAVQLVDALTGHHLWAERYERDLKDIFALQDEITRKILTGVQAKLGGRDVSSAEKFAEKYYRGKRGLDCYLKLMEGWGYTARFNIEGNNLARRIIEEGIAMCPENPLAYYYLGTLNLWDYYFGNTKSPQETIEKGIELAQKALAMDDSIAAPAHGLLSRLYSCKGEHEKALAEGERAVTLDPNSWVVFNNYASSLLYAGRPEEAIPLFQKSMRLNPRGSLVIHTYHPLGQALVMTGRFEEAVSAYKKALQIAPNSGAPHIWLAITYSMMGRESEARAEAAEVLRIYPKFSVDSFAGRQLYKDQSEKDKIANALRKAGLK